MPTTIISQYWDCFAEAEKTLAYLLTLNWNGFSTAQSKTVMQAALLPFASTWIDTRLDAFVGNWGCSYQTIEIEGVEIEFVVCTDVWVGEIKTCFSDGDCGITEPDCPSVNGFGHPT